MTRKKKSAKTLEASRASLEKKISTVSGIDSSDCYGGDRLDDLLLKLMRSIESAKASKGELPEKIWIKQQFAVGVNDVTRVLERMPHCDSATHCNEEPIKTALRRAPLVPLQAVILVGDCNPKWLTKHIPSMAMSRKVPVIFVKDNKRGSLRLGELVKLKTALAVGIKARGTVINKAIDEVLSCGI
ncbi:hypothetical protein ACMD2_09945 [Ananas comosus]|uniref:Ribosomal protein eL8/eL30/eS12/Gadd45 domain-containing protein n=1 Tax=Ananas comosus TaxID=4615 RepID=A0A199V1T0_ANACO|nr:hypothetical protein ACMD2_09945 [Ananas comosus]